MLLYYDGRRNLVNALQLLVQAREGRTWNFDLTPEVSSVVMRFTNQLNEERIILKVIGNKFELFLIYLFLQQQKSLSLSIIYFPPFKLTFYRVKD